MLTFEDIIQNLDTEIVIQAAIGGISTVISSVLWLAGSNQKAKAKQLEEAVPLLLNEELKKLVTEVPSSMIPYASITGYVDTFRHPLMSHANPDRRGVIWNKVIKEHKEVWGGYAHSWKENEKEISNVVDFIPFYLTNDPENEKIIVNVIDPLESSWTMGALETVHEEFKPVNNSLWDTLVGYLSGNKIKGYRDTEKMLTIGSQLYGFGELVFENGILKLRKPTAKTSNVGEFIISQFSPEEIKNKFLEASKTYQIFSLFFGTMAAVLLYFALKKWIKKYEQYHEIKKEMDDLEDVKSRRFGNASLQRNLSDESICTVCLINPRECVLLPCGHVCVCVDCYYALPNPKKCPICREIATKTVPLFHA